MNIQEEKDYVACIVIMNNDIKHNIEFVLKNMLPPASHESVQGINRINAHLHDKLDELKQYAFDTISLEHQVVYTLCNSITQKVRYLFTHLQQPQNIELSNQLNKAMALVYDRIKEFQALCITVAGLDKAHVLEQAS